MKFLKTMLVLFMSFIMISANSQNVSVNAYVSSNSTNLLGGDVFVTLKPGVVVGVGGSHATSTFFNSEKKDGNDFTNVNYNLAQMPATLKLFNSFVENRGTVSGLVGYSFKSNTTVIGDLGVAFNQTINLFTSAQFNPSNVYPKSTLGYQSKGSSQFTYGGSVIQNFGRLGAMVGYNNVQKFKIGVSFRITPTKMFKY